MSDDNFKSGVQDRRTVVGGEPYEVSFVAKKHGLTHDQVQELIKKFGNEGQPLHKGVQRFEYFAATDMWYFYHAQKAARFEPPFALSRAV